MIRQRVAFVLLVMISLGHCDMEEGDDWFPAEIVRVPELTYAVLHPNHTLEAYCVAKGYPLPAVYFLNEYIDFDYDQEDLSYTYFQINDTFSGTRLVITDPAYAAYMPGLYCETENYEFHDNIFLSVTRL